MTDPVKKILTGTVDMVTDQIEKVSSPASRAGHVIERVGKLVEAQVDRDVIALQLTKRSPNKIVYTTSAVDVMADVYQDSKTTVLITAAQSRALMEDEKQNNRQVRPDLDDPIPA